MSRHLIVIISDTHIGSTMGLCPPSGIALPDGGLYMPNKFQRTLWDFWMHFWTEALGALRRRGDHVTLVINGDLIEGLHHRQVGIISNNLVSQRNAAIEVFGNLPGKVHIHRLFVVRGTEAHSEPDAQSEEEIAREIEAERTETGEYSWWQLWLEVHGELFHIAHHIGATSSAAYESSAPMREMVTGLIEAAQWGRPLPTVFVRSHRHRFIEVPLPTEHGRIRCVITPGWQLRTPHVERIDRMRMPQIGGVIFVVEDGTCEVREKMYRLPQPEPIRL